MAQAYSNDLRCKILESYAREEGSLRELAERFAVSHGYTKKIHREQLHTGQMERKPQSRYGRVSLERFLESYSRMKATEVG